MVFARQVRSVRAVGYPCRTKLDEVACARQIGGIVARAASATIKRFAVLIQSRASRCFARERGSNFRIGARQIFTGTSGLWFDSFQGGHSASLRRFKDDASEVREGFECGIGLENFNDIKVGDQIEDYVIERVAATEL